MEDDRRVSVDVLPGGAVALRLDEPRLGEAREPLFTERVCALGEESGPTPLLEPRLEIAQIAALGEALVRVSQLLPTRGSAPWTPRKPELEAESESESETRRASRASTTL